MCAPTPVCVNDDLTAGEPGVALGTADDELSRGVDVEVCEVAIEGEGGLAIFQDDLRKRLLHHFLYDELIHLLHARSSLVRACVARHFRTACGLARLSMLRGNDNGVELQRLHRAIRLLQVLNGDLGLAVGAQPPEQAALAHIRQLLPQLRGHRVGEWHAILRLVAGVPEHDALITGADVKILLAHMDATCDVGALFVDTHEHLTRLVAKTLAHNAGEVVDVGVEADLRHHPPHYLLIVNLGLGGDLTRHHDHVVLGRRLASHLALRITCKASI
mmetsp:Transcript_88806/g.197346  ORF Transcript_88806/g.197346 Transcript_88806/m.197346 type:complete len:274 (+) Transcript_88806:692-1513(+)